MTKEPRLVRCFLDAGAKVERWIKGFLAGGVLALVLFGVAAAGPLEDGWDAHDRGDYAKAMRLWRPLAERGNAVAQTNLGEMYRFGEGVPEDYEQAVAWYRKAAERGNAVAQTNLGFMYDMGQGVPQDYEQAVAWYRKAAEQGYDAGQLDLGLMYQAGHGVPQDYVRAYMWFNLAVSGFRDHRRTRRHRPFQLRKTRLADYRQTEASLAGIQPRHSKAMRLSFWHLPFDDGIEYVG